MTYCFLTWSLLTTVTTNGVQLARFRVINGTLPSDILFESEFILATKFNESSCFNWLLNGEAHMCTVGLRTAARRAAVRLVYTTTLFLSIFMRPPIATHFYLT